MVCSRNPYRFFFQERNLDKYLLVIVFGYGAFSGTKIQAGGNLSTLRQNVGSVQHDCESLNSSEHKKALNISQKLAKQIPLSEMEEHEVRNKFVAIPISWKGIESFLVWANNYGVICYPRGVGFEELSHGLSVGQFDESIKASVAAGIYFDKSLVDYIQGKPALFPKKVYFRNPRREDVTGNLYYFLNPLDHLLYVKPVDGQYYLQGGVKKSLPYGHTPFWNLFDGEGGPSSLLKKGEYIVEFSAAAELVVVKSNLGQYFYYFPYEFRLPTRWMKNSGFPDGQLFAAADQARWSFNVAAANRPKYRRTLEFMHQNDLVEYFTEKSTGRKIALGFCGSILSLSKNGRQIRVWDTGLPNDFSRFILSPLKGDFVIRGFSSAGSILFVIGYDAVGNVRMFSRMFDYDTFGGNPTLRYEFLDKSKSIPGMETQKSFEEVQDMHQTLRDFPTSGWEEIEPIEDASFISDKITILTTGKGSESRELRVAGVNRLGQMGYFYKGLAQDRWEFMATGTGMEILEDAGRISPEPFKKITHSYAGNAKINGKDLKNEIARIDLFDYHMALTSDEASILRVYSTTGSYFDLEFRTLDAWSPNRQEDGLDQFIGLKGLAEDKLLLGSLTIPSWEYSTIGADPLFNKHFRDYVYKVNVFTVRVNDLRVKIESHHSYRPSFEAFDKITLPKLKIKLARLEDAEDEEPYDAVTVLRALYLNEDLIAYKEDSEETFKSKLAKNEALLKELRAIGSHSRTDSIQHLFSNITATLGIKLFSHFTDTVPIEKSMPYLPSVTRYGYKTFEKGIRVSFDNIVAKKPQEYDVALKTLEKRIKIYKKYIQGK